MKNPFYIYRIASLILLTVLAGLTAHARVVLYDANMDRAFDISDVTATIQYVLTGDASLISLDNADVNLDINVDIVDVTTMIDRLLNGGVEIYDDPEGALTFTVEGVSFMMIPVEGGTFMMGDDQYSWSKPAHEVTLSDFCIGQTEVTQELWFAVMGVNPSWFCSNEGYADDLQRPVESANWYAFQDFIVKLNRLTGMNFRLPTEAEWEFAARGGNKSEGYRYAGSNDLSEVGWYISNIPSLEPGQNGYGTQRVGIKKPNELGLYDMSGNVSEWCQDRYDYYSGLPQVNPTGPETGLTRVIRGGSWYHDALNCELVNRFGEYPGANFITLGFRLAL